MKANDRDRAGEINTDEAYENLLTKFQANQTTVGLSFILWACVLAICGPILLWVLPPEKLPAMIRPFWNIYTVVPLLGSPILLLRWTRLGREARSYRGIGRAINSFERAKVCYENWEQAHRRRDLRQCVEYMKLAEPYLHEVPRFKALQKAAAIAGKEFS